MKYRNLLPAIVVAAIFASCDQQTEAPAPTEPTEVTEPTAVLPTLDTAAMKTDINARRAAIEESLDKYQRVEVAKDKLREKTRQKWEKIHFYQDNGMVVRIKSYPYANISKRTEEFYFSNGELVLAVIQDNGTNENEVDDKLYYFHNGEAFSEVSNNEEEYSTLKAEGEELMEEAKEYLELLKNNK